MAAVTRWFFKSAIRRGPRTTLSRVLIGSGVVYSFSEPELPRLENPITFPKLEKLSPDFLIRQACALSAEQVVQKLKLVKRCCCVEYRKRGNQLTISQFSSDTYKLLSSKFL